ncbi:hypothetical protein [Actinoplanes sp. URMC 104]|uniref:hypothetical protein n=1 Tax=Actinoplanes sp. URMC 104 TaxID=3423409 RepID=UPI003F195E2B
MSDRPSETPDSPDNPGSSGTPHGQQPPPAQDPWHGYRDPGQGFPPAGQGFPPAGYGVPGQGLPPGGYGMPGQGFPPGGYGMPGQALPPGYYAGPDDPLVSADFGGWWRRSFTLLAAVWRPMTLVQLVWAVPLVIVGLVAAFVVPDANEIDADEISFDDFVAPLLVLIVFTFAAVLLSLVANLATLDVLVQRATGQPVSAGRALRTGLRRFFPLVGWQLLAGLMILVGLLFCILPGIYLTFVFITLPAIILLERGRGIGRAFQLFHADFGPALARAATTVGLYAAFALAETVFSTILDPRGDAGTAVSVFLAFVSAAFSIATGVVISPLVLTAYADMRARHEPFSTAYLAPHPGGK